MARLGQRIRQIIDIYADDNTERTAVELSGALNISVSDIRSYCKRATYWGFLVSRKAAAHHNGAVFYSKSRNCERLLEQYEKPPKPRTYKIPAPVEVSGIGTCWQTVRPWTRPELQALY